MTALSGVLFAVSMRDNADLAVSTTETLTPLVQRVLSFASGEPVMTRSAPDGSPPPTTAPPSSPLPDGPPAPVPRARVVETTSPHTGSGSPAAIAATSPSPVALESAWPATPSGDIDDVAGGDRETLDTMLSVTTRLHDPVVHTVDDGGSWWRTVRKIIDDPVPIDRLLDNLAASGMDVAHATPGAELVVDAGVSDGHLLRIDGPGGVYLSHVVGDDVVTSVYRSVFVPVSSSFEDDAVASGLPREVIDDVMSTNASLRLGLDVVDSRDEYGILFRATRGFRDERAAMQTVAVSRNGQLLWVDP